MDRSVEGTISGAERSTVGSMVGDRLVDVGVRCGRWQRELVRLAAEFDLSGEWAFDGAVTAAHWIALRLDVEVCTAREWVRIGHQLRVLPGIDAAFAGGRLSFSKVRVLTRLATAETEAELLELAERTPAGRLARAVAAWQQRHETGEETEDRHNGERSVVWRTEPDGMITGNFRLPPLAGARLTAAIDQTVMRGVTAGRLTERGGHATADASRSTQRDHPTLAQQRADALAHLAESGGSEVSTEVVLHVRADGCSLDDGTPIPDSVVERIAPKSFLRVLIHDAERRPINASGRHRHPTTRQQRVVKERDRRCVDCGGEHCLEYDHVPAHHITHHTIVDEPALRCWQCHAKRHRASTARGADGRGEGLG